MHLAISLRSFKSNRKLGIEVVNFTPNLVGKLTSSLRDKFAPFGEVVSEFPSTWWLRRLGITGLKWVINVATAFLQISTDTCLKKKISVLLGYSRVASSRTSTRSGLKVHVFYI